MTGTLRFWWLVEALECPRRPLSLAQATFAGYARSYVRMLNATCRATSISWYEKNLVVRGKSSNSQHFWRVSHAKINLTCRWCSKMTHGRMAWRGVVNFHVAECVDEFVIKIQHLHKIVNLLFTIIY